MIRLLDFARPLRRKRDHAPVRILATDLQRDDGLTVVFAVTTDKGEEIGCCQPNGLRSGNSAKWAIENVPPDPPCYNEADAAYCIGCGTYPKGPYTCSTCAAADEHEGEQEHVSDWPNERFG